MAGGSKSNFLELELLDHVLGNAAYSAPATVYIALFTGMGTEAQAEANTNFTECTGGSYARATVTNNATNFPAATTVAGTGTKSNGADITFATATASWGTVYYFGIYDAASGGNLLYWGTLSTPKSIAVGDTAKFSAGDLKITED